MMAAIMDASLYSTGGIHFVLAAPRRSVPTETVCKAGKDLMYNWYAIRRGGGDECFPVMMADKEGGTNMFKRILTTV